MKVPALILVLAMCVCLGCVTAQTTAVSIPQFQMAEAEGCQITMTPIKGEYPFFTAFSLEFKNGSQSELSIDWNRSRYFKDGRNMGKLVYRGMDPKEVAAGTVPRDRVPAGGTLTRLVAPQQLIAWEPGRDRKEPVPESALSAGMLPWGVNRVVLVMEKDGREISADLAVDLQTVSKPKPKEKW